MRKREDTVLCDSKGKEIFEGDILSFACDYARTKAPGKYDELDRVVRRTAGGRFVLDGLPLASERFFGIEVIGNIFDNPELSQKV